VTFLNFQTPPLASPGRLKLDIKFCVHVNGCWSCPKLRKVGYSRIMGGVTWPTFKFCDRLHISGTATATVLCVHSMQPLPNYFGLLFKVPITQFGSFRPHFFVVESFLALFIKGTRYKAAYRKNLRRCSRKFYECFMKVLNVLTTFRSPPVIPQLARTVWASHKCFPFVWRHCHCSFDVLTISHQDVVNPLPEKSARHCLSPSIILNISVFNSRSEILQMWQNS